VEFRAEAASVQKIRTCLDVVFHEVARNGALLIRGTVHQALGAGFLNVLIEIRCIWEARIALATFLFHLNSLPQAAALDELLAMNEARLDLAYRASLGVLDIEVVRCAEQAHKYALLALAEGNVREHGAVGWFRETENTLARDIHDVLFYSIYSEGKKEIWPWHKEGPLGDGGHKG
jgi:hypothetical protein